MTKHKAIWYCGICGEQEDPWSHDDDIYITRCKQCETFYCNNCAGNCIRCETDDLCPNCGGTTCYICGNFVCEHCGMEECAICGESTCDECLVECIICEEKCCKNDINRDMIPGNAVCTKCATEPNNKRKFAFQTQLMQFVKIETNNRKELWESIQKEFLELLKLSFVPYYCIDCSEVHANDDKSYESHKNNPQNLPDFPLPPASQIEELTYSQIVGIYYTGNGEYVKSLPSKSILVLRLDSTNTHDDHAVEVWHNEHRLGFLPRPQNRNIFDAINSGHSVTCLLGRYRPSFKTEHITSNHRRRHWEEDYIDEDGSNIRTFSPERADITLHIFNETVFGSCFNALLDLYQYTQDHHIIAEHIYSTIAQLGFRSLNILENRSGEAQCQKILQNIYDSFKVKDEKTGFSILL